MQFHFTEWLGVIKAILQSYFTVQTLYLINQALTWTKINVSFSIYLTISLHMCRRAETKRNKCFLRAFCKYRYSQAKAAAANHVPPTRKITIRRTQLQHSFYFISDEQMALRVLLWTAKRCVFHRADITAGSYNKRSLLTYGHMTASHESFSRIRQLTPTCTTHLIYGLLGQQVCHLPRNYTFIGSGALAVRPHQFLQHRLQNMWCV